MKTDTLIIGGILGFTGVILGALGAHALKGTLDPEQLSSYETAVRFQMYHALAIMVTGWINRSLSSGLLRKAIVLWLAGVLLFSGSIYLLSTRPATGLEGIGWLGPVTPLGGLLLIAAWALVIVAGFRKK